VLLLEIKFLSHFVFWVQDQVPPFSVAIVDEKELGSLIGNIFNQFDLTCTILIYPL